MLALVVSLVAASKTRSFPERRRGKDLHRLAKLWQARERSVGFIEWCRDSIDA